MKSNYPVNGITLDHRRIGYEDIDSGRPSDITTGVLLVVVPYTTPELTRAALGHAARHSELNVHVSLVDVQVVPFPRSLDQPQINKEFSKRRLHQLCTESGLPGRTTVVYTRDWLEGFRRMIEPKSLVILTTHKRWWPTREKKLARALLKAGHQVMLLPAR